MIAAAPGRFPDVMRPPWIEAFDDADPAVALQRTRLALDTVIARSRPAAVVYAVLLAGYALAFCEQPVERLAAAIAIAAQLGLGLLRLHLYRRWTASPTADPDRWRLTFVVAATAVLIAWDAFLVFEVWQRGLDSGSMLLLTSSAVLRATGAYTVSPDVYAHRLWSRWSRAPLVLVPFVLAPRELFVIGFVSLAQMAYAEAQCRQLNLEFWRRIAATESLAAAHAALRREVAMRERAEVELRLAQKLESVGRLAGGLAHELNTPLQIMVGGVGVVDDDLDALLAIARAYQATAPADPRRAAELDDLARDLPESLALIRDGLARTATIVRSVQTFARPNTVDRARINLNEALVSTLAVARPELAEVADVVTELGELPPFDGYASELNEAFFHLIRNAAQAIAPVHAATGARGTLTVTTRCRDGYLEIAVADTGVGIPAAIHDRVFDPFFTTKEVGQGAGQGLTIAHAVITQRHRGELRFTSAPGAGTTFTIRLPGAQALAPATTIAAA